MQELKGVLFASPNNYRSLVQLKLAADGFTPSIAGPIAKNLTGVGCPSRGEAAVGRDILLLWLQHLYGLSVHSPPRTGYNFPEFIKKSIEDERFLARIKACRSPAEIRTLLKDARDAGVLQAVIDEYYYPHSRPVDIEEEDQQSSSSCGDSDAVHAVETSSHIEVSAPPLNQMIEDDTTLDDAVAALCLLKQSSSWSSLSWHHHKGKRGPRKRRTALSPLLETIMEDPEDEEKLLLDSDIINCNGTRLSAASDHSCCCPCPPPAAEMQVAAAGHDAATRALVQQYQQQIALMQLIAAGNAASLASQRLYRYNQPPLVLNSVPIINTASTDTTSSSAPDGPFTPKAHEVPRAAFFSQQMGHPAIVVSTPNSPLQMQQQPQSKSASRKRQFQVSAASSTGQHHQHEAAAVVVKKPRYTVPITSVAPHIHLPSVHRQQQHPTYKPAIISGWH